MSVNDVYLLAGLLRSCGDRVLNGESKLRLTPSLLNKLNACFSQIVTQDSGTDFQVIPAHGSQLTQLSQLDFLHDFVQKTPGLTISGALVGDETQNQRRSPRQRSFSKSSNTGAILDLSRFRQLHHLEVRGGTVESVAGVSALRGHIRTLMLIRMGEANYLGDDDLLKTVLAGSLHISTDAHKDAWWPSLTQLVACYCNLRTLGPCLSLAPRLVVLDLSHNALSDESALAAQLGVLLNLKYLNLSFNRLTCIPELRPELQYLVISHNHISHLENVELLTGLLELNIVMNHLSDHSELKDLWRLPSLHRLYLSGNPLSFHPKHRLLTCANLPRHAVQVKFLLDGKPLAKREHEVILSQKRDPLTPVARVTVSESAPNLSEFQPEVSDGSLLDSQRLSQSQSFTQSISGVGSRRNRKVHNVVITDVKDIEHTPYSTAIAGSSKKNADDRSPSKTSQKFGAFFDTSTPKSSPLHPSCVAQMMEERLLNMDPVKPTPPPPMLPRTVIKSAPSSSASSVFNVTAGSSTYHTADDSSTTLMATADCTLEQTLSSDTSTTAIESHCIESTEISDDESGADSEGEDTERLMHIAQIDIGDDKDNFVFLSVSKRCIKQLATDTLKVLDRWPLATLVSCSSSGDGRLNLVFKGGNDNCKSYKMSQREVEEVLERLGKIIEARNVSSVNRMTVIHCMQCSAVFTQELRGGDAMASSSIPEDPLTGAMCCPVCSSKVLVQADDKVLPDVESPKESPILESDMAKIRVEIASSALEHSPSDSSIGSAVSLDSCSDPTALTGSNCISPAVTSIRRYESDIDIISNPSQSSIEILEDSSRSTPGRKRSSEERQVVAVPSLLPVPETSQPLAGLTESSSSGSMTDSVCTAYENGAAGRRPASATNQLASNVLREEPSRESSPMANRESQEDTISAMLNGLLEAVGNETPPRLKTLKEDLLQEKLTFNYDNLAAIDHRLKLHLYLSVLEDKEELLFILRTEVYTRNPVAHYEGIFVVSSDKIYVLKITGPEDNDRIASWLTRSLVFPRTKIVSLSPLPWMGGVRLQLRHSTEIIFLLRDNSRTINLMKFSKDKGLPVEQEIREADAITAAAALNKVLDQLEDESEDVHHIETSVHVCSAIVRGKDGAKKMEWEGCSLVVCGKWVVITDDAIWSLVSNTKDRPPDPIRCLHSQPVSNLMKVHTNECRLSLEFLDETLGEEQVWQIVTKTANVLKNVIYSLRLVWEPIFSVPLQVTQGESYR